MGENGLWNGLIDISTPLASALSALRTSVTLPCRMASGDSTLRSASAPDLSKLKLADDSLSARPRRFVVRLRPRPTTPTMPRLARSALALGLCLVTELAGCFHVQPGDTLRRLVARAGGASARRATMGLAGAASESFDGARIGPPPDIPSLLLNNRIVYVGMPITAGVSELIVAEFLYLQYESDMKPCFVYINSPGLITENRQLAGLDTEGFAIVDTMNYIKCPINTICVGKAYGMAALMLASGDKGKRAVMPYSSVMLQQPIGYAQVRARTAVALARARALPPPHGPTRLSA